MTYERDLIGWRDRERTVQPDLVVAAVESTETVLANSARPARGFPVPVLFVQHETDFCRDIHIDERLIDRITSPFLDQDLLGRVDALVRVRSVIHGDPVKSLENESDPTEPRSCAIGTTSCRISGRSAPWKWSRACRGR